MRSLTAKILAALPKKLMTMTIGVISVCKALPTAFKVLNELPIRSVKISMHVIASCALIKLNELEADMIRALNR